MFKTISVVRHMAASAAAAAMIVGLAIPAQAERAGKSGTGAATSESEAPAAKRPSERKYCLLYEGTGSRMTRKICKTKAQWNAEGQDIGIK